MKLRLHRWLPFTASFWASAVVSQAHPGHEGGEVTWDLTGSHLTAHPCATLICAIALTAGAWAGAQAASAAGNYVAVTVRRIASGRRV